MYLSPEQFRDWLRDPHAVVVVAEMDYELIGYSVTLTGADAAREPGAPQVSETESLAYLSKFYLERSWRGSGLARLLMNATITHTTEIAPNDRETLLWVGTSETNRRAIKAYKKQDLPRTANASSS